MKLPVLLPALGTGLLLIAAQTAVAAQNVPGLPSSRVADRLGARISGPGHDAYGWEVMFVGFSTTTFVIGTALAGVAISCFSDQGDSD